jgi:hypothetical protein
MPRNKQHKRQIEEHVFLMFEIKVWEPSYSFSLNRQKNAETDYSEYAELHFQTICIYPEKYSGRTASMIMSGRRGLFVPQNPRREQCDRPTNIGLLELPPSGGSFYGGVPHDTMAYLLSALIDEKFQFIMLSGFALKRSAFFCTELNFARTSD